MIASIMALPFIQFGINWWITIGSLGSIVILYAYVRFGKIQIFKLDGFTTAILFMMAVVYIWQDLGDSHSFLRISREALLLMLVVILNQNYKPLKSIIVMQNIDRALLVVMIIEFALAVVQFFFLRKGIWIGPGADWFGGRGNSIPTLLDLQYSKLRPSGTFSEPSYLGIFCVSILILVSRNSYYSLVNRTTFFVSLVTIVVSQSKSALFFALAILLVQRRNKLLSGSRNINTFFLPLTIIMILPFFNLLTKTVQSSVNSISIQNRIFEPMTYVVKFLFEHPLGISFYGRISELIDSNKGITWEVISHNSVFNFIFSYGIVGLAITLRILFVGGRDYVLMLYLTMLMLQNGGFLDFDKLFLVTVVIYIYRIRLINSGARIKTLN